MAQANAVINDTAQSQCPELRCGADPSVFTTIYTEGVTIAVWQRSPQAALNDYANTWVNDYPAHNTRAILALETLETSLDNALPEAPHKATFQQDIMLLVDMFACLFDVKEVGVRLTPLRKAMCPRFHVDNIPCRLVTTYGGMGTEWLSENEVNRSRLGRGAQGLPDDQSGVIQGSQMIQQVHNQHVALLKGSGWIDNEERGLVHRSPHLSAGQQRLLLTLDFC